MPDRCWSRRHGSSPACQVHCAPSSFGDKRGKHVAAVATARKLAVIVWHMLTKDEDYTWNRPALLDWKLRKLELKAGHPSRRGGKQKGSAAAYSDKSVRDSERETIGNAEQASKGRSSAANEVRLS
jgi:transposase